MILVVSVVNLSHCLVVSVFKHIKSMVLGSVVTMHVFFLFMETFRGHTTFVRPKPLSSLYGDFYIAEGFINFDEKGSFLSVEEIGAVTLLTMYSAPKLVKNEVNRCCKLIPSERTKM